MRFFHFYVHLQDFILFVPFLIFLSLVHSDARDGENYGILFFVLSFEFFLANVFIIFWKEITFSSLFFLVARSKAPLFHLHTNRSQCTRCKSQITKFQCRFFLSLRLAGSGVRKGWRNTICLSLNPQCDILQGIKKKKKYFLTY